MGPKFSGLVISSLELSPVFFMFFPLQSPDSFTVNPVQLVPGVTAFECVGWGSVAVLLF